MPAEISDLSKDFYYLYALKKAVNLLELDDICNENNEAHINEVKRLLVEAIQKVEDDIRQRQQLFEIANNPQYIYCQSKNKKQRCILFDSLTTALNHISIEFEQNFDYKSIEACLHHKNAKLVVVYGNTENGFRLESAEKPMKIENGKLVEL